MVVSPLTEHLSTDSPCLYQRINPQRRNFLVAIYLFLGFLTATLAVHAPGLNAPMVYDSQGFIAEKEHLFAQEGLRGVLRIVPSRPLFMATLYANYLVTGMNPLFFRLSNAVLLAASGVVLVFLLMLIWDIAGFPEETQKQRFYVSLFLGLLFVVHPLQTFVVLYVWQREAIMACLFFFSGLALYLLLRSGRISHVGIGYVWCGLVFGAALLTKENTITLPVAMVLAELTLFRQGLAGTLRRAALVALVTIPPFLGYLTITDSLYTAESTHPRGTLNRLLEHYEISGFPPSAVLLTECRVLFLYLGTIFAPWAVPPQLLRVMTVSPSLWDSVETTAAFLGVVTLLLAGCALIRRQPLVSFGILFFFLTLAPESTLIPQYLFFGYRPILPMAGLLGIVGYGLVSVWRWVEGRGMASLQFVCILFAGLVIGGVGSITWRQALKWEPLQFWREIFERLPPASANMEIQPYLNTVVGYSSQLIAAGRFSEALEVTQKALEVGSMVAPRFRWQSEGGGHSGKAPPLGPDFSRVFMDMGLSLQKMGKLGEAKDAFLKAIALQPDLPEAWCNLGVLAMQQNHLSEAREYFLKALEVQPSFANAYNGLGEVLVREGKIAEALNAYRKAIELRPSLADPYNNLGNLLLGQGRPAEAEILYRKALRLKPKSAQLRNNLGAALLAMNQAEEARKSFEEALKLNPDSPRYRANLGTALIRLGRIEEGLEYLKRAADMEPDFAPAWLRLGRAYEQAGHWEAAEMTYRKALNVSSGYSDAHLALADLLVKLKRFSEAIDVYEKALELSPVSDRAHAGLGTVFLERGEYQRSVQHFNKAIELNPSFSDAKTKLDLARRKLREQTFTE